MVVLDAVVEDVDQPALAATAGQLVPAVGVLFALLTAFVITNQWNRSRSAEQVVGKEADACIRLALASQSPGIDGQRVRSLLVDYLRAVLDVEWDTLRHERAGSPRAADALSRLERDVRSCLLQLVQHAGLGGHQDLAGGRGLRRGDHSAGGGTPCFNRAVEAGHAVLRSGYDHRAAYASAASR